MDRNAARLAFLRRVIPGLWDAGFDFLAARYSVEADRLEALLAAR